MSPHTPQASRSSSGSLHDLKGAAPGRTRTSDGRSSEERATEEQTFELAAAQLRPTWASGQPPRHAGTGSQSAIGAQDVRSRDEQTSETTRPQSASPVSGTTLLPPPGDAPPVALAHAEGREPGAAPAPTTEAHAQTPAATTDDVDAPWLDLEPDASSADHEVQSTIEVSADIARPDPPTPPPASLLVSPASPSLAVPPSVPPAPRIAGAGEAEQDQQPVFAGARSNFPARPFDDGSAPSSFPALRGSADETGNFSFAPPKRPLNVRLLAIGAAAVVALGSVWALASGGSDDADAARQKTQPAALPVVPARAASTLPAPSQPPAALPMGLEPPKTMLPERGHDRLGAVGKPNSKPLLRPSARAPEGSLRARSGAAVPAQRATANLRSRAEEPRASTKPVGKVTGKPVGKGALTAAKAKPAPAKAALKTKPQAKAAGKGVKRGRLSTDVLDPWRK